MSETPTDKEKHTFDFKTLWKVLQWMSLLVLIILSTSKIIQGIPPSNDVKWVDGGKPILIWIFALICYIIMIVVKTISNRTDNQKDEMEFMNILTYFLICILSYILCLSYLCIKVRQKFEVYDQSGGMFDWMNKGNVPVQDIDESVQFIILIGLLLVIINAFTNLFLYLKSKEKSERDSTARSIYQAQLTVLILMVLTIIFFVALGVGKNNPPWNEVDGWDALNTTRGEVFKTSIYIIILAIGTALVNVGAGSGFFGLTD